MREADAVSKKIEMRTAIPRGIACLAKLKNKNTIEENNNEAESTIEMSLRLLGGMDESKMKETSNGKSTRPSEESLLLTERNN